MPRLFAVLLIVNMGFFAWNALSLSTFAQRPPEAGPDGVPYLRVNINPTAVPPMVNINPPGMVPQVEVARMPEIVIPPVGCDNGSNFETGVGQSVRGPIQLSFLNFPDSGPITFVDNENNSFRVTLNPSGQLNSAIYLRAGQRLEFGTAVLYSGCRPAQ